MNIVLIWSPVSVSCFSRPLASLCRSFSCFFISALALRREGRTGERNREEKKKGQPTDAPCGVFFEGVPTHLPYAASTSTLVSSSITCLVSEEMISPFSS